MEKFYIIHFTFYITPMYQNAFAGKKVFITGHTGFKGGWLAIYLRRLGAEIVGYSLPAPTNPSLFDRAKLANHLTHIEGDIRDAEKLRRAMLDQQPDFVFHLAAQPLVIDSYQNPQYTFDVNVMGTIAVMEAIRALPNPCAAVLVATDKVYENREWHYGYREVDPLGGHDPYSASKAAMEIAVNSYRLSFFPPEKGKLIASVRSGNVIGGGDWADNRIVPDAIRALHQRLPIPVRNPRSLRPWQHVLEPLSGYLWVAAKMAGADGSKYADAWNFGPLPTETHPVRDLVETLITTWGSGEWLDKSDPHAVHEANLLMLSIDRAHALLGWSPVWDFKTTIQHTAAWYRGVLQNQTDAYAACLADIESYEQAAMQKGMAWAE